MKVTKLYLAIILILSSCANEEEYKEHKITKPFKIPLGEVWDYGHPSTATLEFDEDFPFWYDIQASGPGWTFLDKDSPFERIRVMICPNADRVVGIQGFSPTFENASEAQLKEINEKMLFLLSNKYGKEGIEGKDYFHGNNDGKTWKRVQYFGVGRRDDGELRRFFSINYGVDNAVDNVAGTWGISVLEYRGVKDFEQNPDKYRKAFEKKVKEGRWKQDLNQI